MSTPKEEPLKIYLALAAIIQGIEAIGKNRENKAQGFKFRGIDDIYNALHPLFAAHGVICLPNLESVELTDAGKYSNGTPIRRAVVKVKYTFSAPDGSSLSVVVPGEGFDSADKGINKALSAAHKYALIQTFLIPTNDLDADYDSTIDAAAELKHEQELKDAQRADEALQKKRDEAQRKIEEGATAGAKPVEPIDPKKETPATPPEAKSAPKTRAKAEKPASEAPAQPSTPPEPLEEDQPEPKGETSAPSGEETFKTYCIDPGVIEHKNFAGKRLFELEQKQFDLLVKNWRSAPRFQAYIAEDPNAGNLAAFIDQIVAFRGVESKK